MRLNGREGGLVTCEMEGVEEWVGNRRGRGQGGGRTAEYMCVRTWGKRKYMNYRDTEKKLGDDFVLVMIKFCQPHIERPSIATSFGIIVSRTSTLASDLAAFF